MFGRMMHQPLLVSSLICHAAKWHGTTPVVSRTDQETLKPLTWSSVHERAQRLAEALVRLGVGCGDRVGTLGWNHHRHLEAYYAIPGMGGVCHTLNPRLFPPQLAMILRQAGTVGLLVDDSCLPILDAVTELGVNLSWVVVMGEKKEERPSRSWHWYDYEELLSAESGHYDWPQWPEEQAAGLCFTSGTTGNPKGVLYSHRSTVLHAMAVALPDALGFSAGDSILPVVPLFHANAWGIPHAAALVGAKLVLPGRWLDGASLYDLCEREQVTFAAGVPTLWRGLMTYLDDHQLSLHHLRVLGVGGAACPASLVRYFEQDQGVRVLPGWGMTETSPVATLMAPKTAQSEFEGEDRWTWLEGAGRPLFGVDMRLVDDQGQIVPHNGHQSGHLQVRGPWVCEGYWGQEDSPLEGGWFPTGDVATIDGDGFLRITDRSKDLIKSGGEWISSVQVELAAQTHPEVREAAVIGVPHPRWDERPLLLLVMQEGAGMNPGEMQEYLASRLVRWWIPEQCLQVAALPYTATGKVDKVALRQRYATGTVHP
ncbi:MAG: long-chain fatty acid--CoA ligase [Ferrovum sp.]|nr:long-chain fatty acid--CoA ligase [Ferrovum sp.]NDU88107.1 long-chain fatty acid--CoA ligase [Ferrovum sp.]